MSIIFYRIKDVIMHRQKLLQLLERYAPSDTAEQLHREQMMTFVQQQPRCFERELEIGHITASGWLLSADGKRVLLTHHAKLNMWVHLGGHCDGDADVLRVAMKEAQEESGILQIVPVSDHIFDIDIHPIPAYKQTPAHQHYDVRFLLRVVGDEQYVISHESHELRWVDQDRAALPTNHPSIVRMFNKWCAAFG
jgi:8-oxo-dGTP pyrophosphatase MutT (NUDIX family)